MIKNYLILLIVILGQNLLSQDFNLLYSESNEFHHQYSNCCLNDGRCLVIRQDTAKLYPDSILNNRHFPLTPILSIYDSKGNLLSKKPIIYKLGESFIYYFEFVELDGRIFARGIQTKSFKNDTFYQTWFIYQEFDNKTIEPIKNKSYKSYIGIAKISTNTLLSGNDLAAYSFYKKFHKGVDYKIIHMNNYDSVTLKLKDTFFYLLASFNTMTNTLTTNTIYKNFKNSTYSMLYERPVVDRSFFLSKRICNYYNASFDTFGNSENIDQFYNISYDYQMKKLDTYLLKQDISKYVVQSVSPIFNNTIVDNNDTLHHVQYSTVYEKVNNKYEQYYGFVHYKTIDTLLVFNKFLDDKRLSSTIPRGTPTYRPIDNIVPAPDNGYYVVLCLNAFFMPPSTIKIYRLDSKFEIVWSKEYGLTEPRIHDVFYGNFNLNTLVAFKNELGGLTMTFDAKNIDGNVGIYCLKIDSTGKAIKLEGKDLTKNSIVTNSDFAYDYSLYPNPSKEIISLKSKKALNHNKLLLEIFDLLGRKVISTVSDREHRFELKSILNGIYHTKVMDENGEVIHQERLRIEK
ncbi:MAG: T9SS type A sorting domain-containing protein [Chitinophagales bacterium]|jgi:hypothetical protein|nr:T9SS type A sorting domain-containing protein [Sphingobacteriales bacterium]